MPERRLTTLGQLLKVLGDTILREHDRTLQLEALTGTLEQRVQDRTIELASANRSLGVEVAERMEAEKHVRKLLARLVVAQEEERHRVAREIHDHVGQEMTALKLRLEGLQMILKAGHDWSVPLNDVLALLRRLDIDIELLTAGLRPMLVENLGLVGALSSFLDDWRRHVGIPVSFRDPRGEFRLERDAETHLFRIAQEGLNNIHKHAHATRVDVRLQIRDDSVVLTIEDNGRGINVGSDGEQDRGMGLVGMRERAALMGGTLDILATDPQGTEVTVTVPIRGNVQT